MKPGDYEVLRDLLGQYVEVRSRAGQSEYTDKGMLEAYDSQWIRLRKDSETICFPIANIRLLKPLE